MTDETPQVLGEVKGGRSQDPRLHLKAPKVRRGQTRSPEEHRPQCQGALGGLPGPFLGSQSCRPSGKVPFVATNRNLGQVGPRNNTSVGLFHWEDNLVSGETPSSESGDVVGSRGPPPGPAFCCVGLILRASQRGAPRACVQEETGPLTAISTRAPGPGRRLLPDSGRALYISHQ